MTLIIALVMTKIQAITYMTMLLKTWKKNYEQGLVERCNDKRQGV